MFPASAMAGAEDCESGIHQLELVPESRICGNAYRAHYRCSECGQLFEDEEGETLTTKEALSIAELNHNDVELVHQEAIVPSCKAPGSREYWYCPTCNQKFSENNKSMPATDESLVLPALPHTINPESWQAPVAHTCSIDGSVGYYTCSVCEQHFADMEGKTLLTSIVDPARHQLTEHAEKEVSCTEDGNAKYYSCENCDLFFDADKKVIDEDSWVISHEGHQYVGHAANEPTLDSEGNRYYYSCSNCDKLFDADYNETTWDQIVVAKLVAPETKRGEVVPATNKEVVDSGMCGAQGNNLTWTYYDNGELVIEGSGEMTNYPSGGQPWSEYKRRIVAVSLPEGITSIGNYSFFQCNINSISFPNSLIKIGDSALSITNIVEVEIPNSVTTIGSSAFSQCTSLKNITLPSTLASISDFLFSDCTNLESINLPLSIKGIGGYAFKNCRRLTSIVIPEGARYINMNAFSGCTNLQSVSLPKSIKWIRDAAFIGCSGLTNVYYAGTAEGRAVFYGILHDWSSIDNNLLYAANWQYGGNHFVLASGECGASGNNLNWILYENGNMIISGEGAMKDFYQSGTSWRDGDGQSLLRVIKNVNIEEGVTRIGNYAFVGCENLSSILMFGDLKSIKQGAFNDCYSLSDVFFYGTENEWNTINVYDGNNPLKHATIHYLVYDYTITGGTTVPLATVLAAVGLEGKGDLVSVISRDPTRLVIRQEDNVWKVVCPETLASPALVDITLGETAYIIRFKNVGSFVVTFISSHGTVPAEQTVTAGGVATEPEDPTDTNYVFDDWYSDERCTRPFDFTSAINANTNIYAKWKCLVTFHTDYGRAPEARIVEIDGTTRKPDDLSYTGLIFGGWTNAAGTNFNFNTPIRTNTIIYAKWLCRVTFVTAHGDAPPSRDVNIEGTVSNPGNLSWIGYQWGGWTNAEGMVFDFRTPITSNTSLYAKWLPDLEITKGSGGTAHHGSTYAFTLNYYYPDYLKNSSVFTVYVGKHDSGAVMKLKYNDNYLVTQGADKRVVVTLKAPYIQALTEGETYDIIFATGLPNPPEDLGATEGTFKVSKAPKTIFAVTFDRGVATDAENMPKDQTIEAGTKAAKPTTTPTATGYRFDKWCKDAALTTEFDFSKELISTDTTIYAKWVKTHTVKFITEHGVAPTELVVDENGKATKPTDPKMEGYKFDGWFTDKECKHAFSWDTALTEDISLYAKWTGKLEITKGNGGTAHYGSTYEFTLNCSLAQVYDTFTVYVNSKWLDPEKYELSEGSTVVTLKKEYIRSLAAGTYNIEFDTGIDDLGSVKGTFKVSTSPKTGDESDIGLWIAVGCLSAVAAAAIVVYLIRKKK